MFAMANRRNLVGLHQCKEGEAFYIQT